MTGLPCHIQNPLYAPLWGLIVVSHMKHSYFDDLETLRKELDECHGEVELCYYHDTKEVNEEPRIRRVMTLWAQDRGHALRNPMHSQYFSQMTVETAKDWLTKRLTNDLVFESDVMNTWHAKRVVESIFSLVDFESAYTERFIIKDYTFSAVLIISGMKDSVVVAFFGED